MIFVMVGTNEAPFDRLLCALERLESDELLVVQHGPSSIRPGRASCVDFLPFDAVLDHVRAARIVVTHAGVGSIMTTLAEGKCPVVVPRLKRFGEAVDDHQLPLGRRMHDLGLVRLIADPTELARSLGRAPAPPAVTLVAGGGLRTELRDYLAARSAGSPTPPAPVP